MTRWLIAGSAGMLGRDLTDLLRARGEDVVGHTRADLDITDVSAVTAAFAWAKPDVVANCAAWTAVDAAEAHEDEALAINSGGAACLAAVCADAGAILVQPSTDYVFDGRASAPYAEQAIPAPRTAYGRTKLAGELAVRAALPDSCYVVRTAWLYGAHGRNFVHTMLRLARAGTSPAVVDDQRGQPTWTRDVAAAIYALVTACAPAGVYHATSSGETTWFGLAQEVFRLYRAAAKAEDGQDPEDQDMERTVVSPRPITTADYPLPAPRPAYSVLGHAAWDAAGVAPISDWRDALRRAFPEMLAAPPR
jgi:dTDP-4-dehydrorhamnose reductase